MSDAETSWAFLREIGIDESVFELVKTGILATRMPQKPEGKPVGIVVKLNNLKEQVLVNQLYEASKAGVTLQLIVLSICSLQPGITGRICHIGGHCS